MATKQDRLYEHAKELNQCGGKTWGEIWEAQATYLDQYFIERELVDKRLQTWEQLREAALQGLYATMAAQRRLLPSFDGIDFDFRKAENIIRAALNAAGHTEAQNLEM